MSLVNAARTVARKLGIPSLSKRNAFLRRFSENLEACTWEPHPDYSVFTQYDGSHYRSRRDAFLRKYKTFWAVSRTISPRRILEMGTHAGAGADAYLSATPAADYVGFDFYGAPWLKGARHELTGEPWEPREIAERLFTERGVDFKIYDVDLRTLAELPERSDFVVVDAAHDYENALGDLRLALTAGPTWLFVDDYADEVIAACRTFLAEIKPRVGFTATVPYLVEGGLVIKLK